MKQSDALKSVHIQQTYHIVFSTYYRYPTLYKSIYKDRVSKWIREICTDKKIGLVTFKVLTDHVHLLIVKKPNQLLPMILQAIKGITTYYFFQEYPEMIKEIGKTRLWNRGYNETLIHSQAQLDNTIEYIENNVDKYRQGEIL